MKKSSLLCLLGLLSFASATWPQSKSTDGIEKEVAALEQKWLQATKTSNPDLLAPLLADRFMDTSSDGTLANKAETLADTKASKWESAAYDSVRVTVFGNTAIATGVLTGKGTDAKGKPVQAHERWTDTWIKMPNGLWQCVASHGSPIKM
jgi:ketosteroid isomerase-like protein